MDFLGLAGRRIVVFGLANRKSVACAVGRVLVEAGAEVVHVVRTDERAAAWRLFPKSPVFVCDVEDEANIVRVRDQIAERVGGPIHGLVHSIAFANYSEGLRPFHRTCKRDFLQAMDISCFSFISLANRHRATCSTEGASVVTVSIDHPHGRFRNYGYMAPVKAALESSLCSPRAFRLSGPLQRGLPRLLKTSASAGIPGYVDSYLFAEQATLRKRAVQTDGRRTWPPSCSRRAPRA